MNATQGSSAGRAEQATLQRASGASYFLPHFPRLNDNLKNAPHCIVINILSHKSVPLEL